MRKPWRRCKQRLRGRSRRCADALHADALLSRAGRRSSGRARGEALPALQGGRSRRRRSPRSRACRSPKTTTSASRFTITKAPCRGPAMKYLAASPRCARRRWPSGRGHARLRRSRLHRCDRAGRHPLHPQQRPGRQEVSAGNAGLRVRLLRCRWRRLARHPADQQQGLDAARTPIPARALSQQPQRHVHRHHGRQRPGRRDVRHGRRRRRLRQRRPRRRLHHRARRRPPVPQRRQRQVPRCHQGSPESSNANFGTSAAWLDYDRDGKLDLFVANYVQWTPKSDLWCSLDGATKSYCTPESYKGTRRKLYHNLGDGRFEDVAERPAWAIRPASRWA